jgi:hypothetical protein
MARDPSFAKTRELYLDKPEVICFRADKQLAVALRSHALVRQLDLSSLLRELVREGCQLRGIDTSWRAL